MHSLQKQVHDFIRKEELLTEDDHTLLAVSGGLDSMVLAHLFLRADLKFSIAHCNFGLRGAESDGDEALVKSWCSENGITLHQKRFELGVGSTQLNARNARYEWFEELCDTHAYSKLGTAHHLNDSLETLLLNLTRGTGPRGMVGIRPKADKTIRPLLFATKSELEAYAKEVSVEWREDASNSAADYDRNRVRLEVIPKLEELNPSLITTFSDTSERLRMGVEILRDEVDRIKKEHLKNNRDLFELDVRWISKSSDLLLLSEILSEFGFNYPTCKEIHTALGHAGKVFYAPSYELSVDRSSVFIKPITSEFRIELVVDGYGGFSFAKGQLSISNVERGSVDFKESSSVIYVDEDKVTFPLTIRNWQQGDKFQPLGMLGSKKVSDFLIDKKVPVALKNDTLVLVYGDEIVWLVEHQISEKFKISEDTERVLRMELVLN